MCGAASRNHQNENGLIRKICFPKLLTCLAFVFVFVFALSLLLAPPPSPPPSPPPPPPVNERNSRSVRHRNGGWKDVHAACD